MKLHIEHKNYLGLNFNTLRLQKKLHGSIFGLCRQINTVRRADCDPKLFTMGGDLSGAHLLINRDPPRQGSYHIGGSGFFRDEALIRTLGESVERYAQLVGYLNYAKKALVCTYQQLPEAQRICQKKFEFFDDRQYKNNFFPFSSFSADAEISWAPGLDCETQQMSYLPAQLIFVGYNLVTGEPWLGSAVTTGTAVHSKDDQAHISAVLELIQLDTAMGFWYSQQQAQRILIDDSLIGLNGLLNKAACKFGSEINFYLLKNPDMPGLTVAAVFRQKYQLPRVAIGLGVDFSLESAMYKAYLEAVGVFHLAKLQSVYVSQSQDGFDPSAMSNLDDNVSWYAQGNKLEHINFKFPIAGPVLAAKNISQENLNLKDLLDSFTKTNKKIYSFDLNIRESKELNLIVARYYSPDLLALCLPSFPTLKHKRYQAYGIPNYVAPHPFP